MSQDVRVFSFAELSLQQKDVITVNVGLDEINRFAALSGDVAPLHMNETFAQKQGFKGRVAHGMLIGAYISQFVGNRLPGANGILQQMDISFRSPLIPPAQITIEGEIETLSLSVGQVVVKIKVLDAAGKVLATAKVKSLVRVIG